MTCQHWTLHHKRCYRPHRPVHTMMRSTHSSTPHTLQRIPPSLYDDAHLSPHIPAPSHQVHPGWQPQPAYPAPSHHPGWGAPAAPAMPDPTITKIAETEWEEVVWANGTRYFFNPYSRESQWDTPAEVEEARKPKRVRGLFSIFTRLVEEDQLMSCSTLPRCLL